MVRPDAQISNSRRCVAELACLFVVLDLLHVAESIKLAQRQIASFLLCTKEFVLISERVHSTRCALVVGQGCLQGLRE